MSSHIEEKKKVRVSHIMPEDTLKQLKLYVMRTQGDYRQGDQSKFVNLAIEKLIQGKLE